MTPEQIAALYAEIFGETPEELASLTPEELAERIQVHESGLARIATGEAFAELETQPDRNVQLGMLRDAKTALLALRAEQTERQAEDESFAAEVEAELAEVGVTLEAEGDAGEGEDEEDAGEGEGAGEDEAGDAASGEEAGDAGDAGDVVVDVDAGAGDAEPGSEAAAEPVTAGAAAPARREYRRPPATPRRNQPIRLAEDGPVLVASAGHERIREGTPLDRESLSQITMAALRRFTTRSEGVREQVVIASAFWGDEYPEERKLEGDLANDQAKIDAVTGRPALLAAGGWCAPSTIRYDIDSIGSQSRPVRDALTPFLATRGGLQFVPGLSIAGTDTTGGITRLVEEEDAAGGESAVKECLVIDCPEFTDVRADIIATCLQAGNLMERAYPEVIAAWQDLIAVAAARNRDAGLLDAISDDPQTVHSTAAKVYGAFYSIVYAYARAASGYRSRHRLDDQAVLRSLAPAWLADLLVVDLLGRQFPLTDVTRSGIAALIERYTSVNVEWYLDTATGEGQVMGAQGENAEVLNFPDTAVSYLWPEGGILYIDQGELNLGIVRDSVLNRTNDVQFFAEVFENAAVTAAEVIEIESTICPTGETGPTATALAC